uniref:Uncharacterized protein n=1 Tax=Glossina palpalis gambiensis TaxID=67801 RepID=A0A1B0BSQ1_9MUSC
MQQQKKIGKRPRKITNGIKHFIIELILSILTTLLCANTAGRKNTTLFMSRSTLSLQQQSSAITPQHDAIESD